MKRRAHSLFRGISRTSRNIIKLCFLCVFSLSSLMIQAQDNQRISVDLREETLESVLWYLQNRTKFIFMYATEDIANITDISVRAKDKTITEILNECLEGTNLTYEISGSAIVIKKRKTDKITISGWIVTQAVKHFRELRSVFEDQSKELLPDWTDTTPLAFRHRKD